MTKNLVKVMAAVLVAIMVVAALATFVGATDYMDPNITAKDDSGAASSMQAIVASILAVVQVVGIGVAVIMLIVLAIKYISAAPGDKADIKKHAVVYVVGAVVLFAASGILQIIKNFATGTIKPSGAKG